MSDKKKTLQDEQKRLQSLLSSIHQEKIQLSAEYNDTLHALDRINSALRELTEATEGGKRDAV